MEAPGINAEAINVLVATGKRAGLDVRIEYPVAGGRVDVVWLWPNRTFPEALPVAGFEVESSWRTRKHIKGDYLNLLDLQPAVGVIVLLGQGGDVESTRAFARQMVQSRPGRMLVWSDEDLQALDAEDLEAPLSGAPTRSVEPAHTPETVTTERDGKYTAFTHWLAGQSEHEIEISFAEVEHILGFALPASARRHRPYWSGGQAGSTIGNAIRAAGWRARQVDLQGERVTLVREHGS